jgi:hypothetical protein
MGAVNETAAAAPTSLQDLSNYVGGCRSTVKCLNRWCNRHLTPLAAKASIALSQSLSWFQLANVRLASSG